MDRQWTRVEAGVLVAVLVVGGTIASCAGPSQTPEQAKAQKKFGSATQEPTRVAPPSTPVNPPPPIIRPSGPSAAKAPPTEPAPRALAASEPPPVAAPVASQAVGESYKPAWWIAEPSRQAGRLSVAASAEGESLMEARGRVVGAGLARLKSGLGGVEPKNPQTLKTGVVLLGEGRYRAFILMAADE